MKKLTKIFTALFAIALLLVFSASIAQSIDVNVIPVAAFFIGGTFILNLNQNGIVLGANSHDLSALTATLGAYARKNLDVLFNRIYFGFNKMGYTVIDGITDEQPVTQLRVGSVLQSGDNKDFEPVTNAIEYKASILKVRDWKVDLKLEPWKFEKTYLANRQAKTDDPKKAIPFEQQVMQMIQESIQEDFILNTVHKGVYSTGGANPADVCDGFLTHRAALLDDEIVLPVNTGAITSSNVIDKIELVAKGLNPALKAKRTEARISPTIYEWYLEKYRSTFGGNMNYKGMDGSEEMIKLDGRNAWLINDPGMEGSEAITFTPTGFMIIGCNTSLDSNNIDIQPFDRYIKILMDGKIGVQYGYVYDNHLVTNERD
jgi:hypothetical protein